MTKLNKLKKQITQAFSEEALSKLGLPEEEIVVFRNYKLFPRELLVQADWNYKEEDEFVSKQLVNNIKRIGQVENIHVRELDTGYYEIINGNHRDTALSELGKEFVVAYDHGKVTIEEAIRRAIETNETKFKANSEKLAKLLQEIKLVIPDIELSETLPYQPEELDALINQTLSDMNNSVIDIEEDDYQEPLPETPKTQPGDLYELNGHRLLCGDSTNPEDVAKLMNGRLAHILFTDPPYNINYPEFNKNRSEGGKDWTDSYCSEWKDSMSDSDYISFLKSFIQNAKNNLIEWGHYYIWHASTYYRELITVLEELNIPYDKVPIQWVKQVAPLSWVRYKRITEPCIFGGRGAVNGNGEGARWFGPNNETNAWIINREHNGSYIHPTQKPVALAARGINNSTRDGELVLDLFLGSGSTLIASDMLNRICYGMELEPVYCDHIVKRFFKYCADNQKECVVKLNGNVITNNYFD